MVECKAQLCHLTLDRKCCASCDQKPAYEVCGYKMCPFICGFRNLDCPDKE